MPVRKFVPVCPSGMPGSDADARAPHLDRLNMGSPERGDSILGSKLCSFTTSPLCLPEAAAMVEATAAEATAEATLCVTCGNKRRASRSLSLSVSSRFSFGGFQAASLFFSAR